jgi:palmitoyl-protein thioesterase
MENEKKCCEIKFNSRPTQNVLAPSTYWHDLSEQRYRRRSTFLALINNVNEINFDYVKNLQSLEKLVLVKYEKDQAIIPNESTHFGYWDVNRNSIQLEQSDLYTHDRLGLREMKKNGQLIFISCPNATHLELNEEWFVEEIILPYLK